MDTIGIQPSANDLEIKNGSLILRRNGVETGRISYLADAKLGARSAPGTIRLLGKDGKAQRVYIDGGNSSLWLGGNGKTGDVFLVPSEATTDFTRATDASIHLAGGKGAVILRGGGVALFDHSETRMGELRVGDGGVLVLRDGAGIATITLHGSDARLVLGAERSGGDLLVRNADKKTTIRLNGDSGDITLQNGDCAEQFEVDDSADLNPGTVAVLNEQGRIEESRRASDRRVVGVVAGAGDIKPGIVLGNRANTENKRPSLPIALLGRVFCKVDAHFGSVRVGDFLASSDTPGHAMKVTNRDSAAGAVIGKALGALTSGRGLVQVLVTLQ